LPFSRWVIWRRFLCRKCGEKVEGFYTPKRTCCPKCSMPKRPKVSDQLRVKMEEARNWIGKNLRGRVKVYTLAEKLAYCQARGLKIDARPKDL